MSLKDDIEAIAKVLKYEPPTTMVLNAKESISRIEAALALDDGPPKIGDIVYHETSDDDTMDTCWEITEVKSELFRALLTVQREHVILMRADEVERRIKEAGK